MGFTDSFNSALRGGALLQGLLYSQEQRDLNNTTRRAEEFSRGVDMLEQQFGADTGAYTPEARGMMRDLMNEYADLPGLGDRKYGQATFDEVVPAGGGVAAIATVPDGKGGTSTGPLTDNASVDGEDNNDPVSIVKDVRSLKQPVMRNVELTRIKMNAAMNSPTAAKLIGKRLDERNTINALEDLYGNSNDGVDPAQSPVQDPTSPNQIPQPPAPVGEGVQAATATPAAVSGAVTTPGPAPITTPSAAAPNGKFTAPRPWVSPEAEGITMTAAQENGIDPDLFKAVVYHESAGGDVNAQSTTGASGLGQMTGIAVKEVNRIYGTNYTREQMRTDPKANADASAKLLKYELEQANGNVEQALAAYNGGRTALKRAGGDVSKMRPESAAYPGKVLALLSQAPSAEAQGPSAEAPATSAQTPDPSTQDQVAPRSRRGRNKNTSTPLERIDAKIARSEKRLGEMTGSQAKRGRAGASGRKGAETKIANLKKDREEIIAKKNEAADATTAAAAETDVVAKQDAVVDDFIASFTTRNDGQKKVLAELKSTPAPSTKEEVVQAAETVKATKPAKKMSEKQRKALYQLHRLNPTQFPLKSVITALETGRLTKKEWKTFQNGVGQTIKIDSDGNQTVLGNTPENQAYINAKLSKASTDARAAAVKGARDNQVGQLAQTKSRTDFMVSQAENIHGGDPAKMADFRDKANTTVQTMGLNLDAQETPTAINTAARVQKLYNEDNGPAWYNLWLKGEPFNNDYSFGMAVQNVPNSPYDPRSPDDSEVIKAGEYYKENYLDPVIEGFPALSKQKQTQATYMATHLEKNGMSRKDAIRVAGTVIGNSRFATVGEAIAAADQKMAAFARK